MNRKILWNASYKDITEYRVWQLYRDLKNQRSCCTSCEEEHELGHGVDECCCIHAVLKNDVNELCKILGIDFDVVTEAESKFIHWEIQDMERLLELN